VTHQSSRLRVGCDEKHRQVSEHSPGCTRLHGDPLGYPSIHAFRHVDFQLHARSRASTPPLLPTRPKLVDSWQGGDVASNLDTIPPQHSMLSQRWIQRCGILSLMLSLGSCGGLPTGGETRIFHGHEKQRRHRARCRGACKLEFFRAPCARAPIHRLETLSQTWPCNAFSWRTVSTRRRYFLNGLPSFG
jgi:hypothetical protein